MCNFEMFSFSLSLLFTVDFVSNKCLIPVSLVWT